MAGLTLGWIQLASALGAAHGVLLTGMLWVQQRNRTANRLLSALVAACSLYLAASVYYATPLFRAYPQFFGLSYPTPWLFGPLVYLYARAAGDRAWRVSSRDLVHFGPALVCLCVALPYIVVSSAEKLALLDAWKAHGEPVQLALLEPTKYVSGIAYSVATIAFLRRHRHRILDSYSNVGSVNLAWLGWLSGSSMAIWILAAALFIPHAGTRIQEEHVSLAIALLVYAIGYMGLRQPEIFRYETAEFPNVQLPPARYDRSGLNGGEAERLRADLLAVMETQQPWKHCDLTLADLAGRLASTPHKLSEVLNGQIGQTFYDFVNGYRVREVQRRIRAGDAGRLKMLALAFDAGFSSKSTFNEVFKKHTSQTPSAFRQTIVVLTD